MGFIPTNSLFEEPWWLDAVARGRWDAVEVCRGGELVARLPYVRNTRLGLTAINNPPLTQTLGPWLDARVGAGNTARRLQWEKEVVGELIDGLPKVDYFAQSLDPSLTNWLPFHWRGYQQTTRYTYVIDSLEDTERVWAGFQSNVRRNVRKAERTVTVTTGADADELYRLASLVFERQGRAMPYSRDLLARVVRASSGRGAGRIYCARDAEGNSHAAILVVWDARCAYYLVGGADPHRRNSEAGSLLFWHAIRDAASVTRRFDFEGSMLEPVERHFRGFGARQVPYLRVMHCSRRARFGLAVRDAAMALVGR